MNFDVKCQCVAQMHTASGKRLVTQLESLAARVRRSGAQAATGSALLRAHWHSAQPPAGPAARAVSTTPSRPRGRRRAGDAAADSHTPKSPRFNSRSTSSPNGDSEGRRPGTVRGSRHWTLRSPILDEFGRSGIGNLKPRFKFPIPSRPVPNGKRGPGGPDWPQIRSREIGEPSV